MNTAPLEGRWGDRLMRQVAVWYLRTEPLPEPSARELSCLSVSERLRYDRLSLPHSRRDFAYAHLLLRRALSQCSALRPSEWQFTSNRFGKPTLVERQFALTSLQFNLTHTHGLVACAITQGVEVGLDIERRGRAGTLAAAQRHFAYAEVRSLLEASERNDYDIRFTQLWTLKESFSKAKGLGHSLKSNSFAFRLVASDALTLETEDSGQWTSWLAELRPDAYLGITVNDTVGNRTLHFYRPGGSLSREVTVLRGLRGDTSAQGDGVT